MKDIVLETDHIGLPSQTSEFIRAVHNLEFDRVQIHGIFVMLGLHAVTPRSQAEISALFENLDVTIPINRTANVERR